ncbi:MAG TPA: hypothetical protein VGR45_17275 [Stellaceae bacterium]|nr:hypothetical protein [Stellaceae bacterium]
MSPDWLNWLSARLREPTTWLGIAAFFASTGASLAAGGLPRAGLIVGAIGAGAGGVGAFIARENGQATPTNISPPNITFNGEDPK